MKPPRRATAVGAVVALWQNRNAMVRGGKGVNITECLQKILNQVTLTAQLIRARNSNCLEETEIFNICAFFASTQNFTSLENVTMRCVLLRNQD